MNKQEIKEMLHHNIMICIYYENHPQLQNNMYNYDFIEYMLQHLRNILCDNGVRYFKEYLKSFKYKDIQYESPYLYLLTYYQENTTQLLLNTLKDKILN